MIENLLSSLNSLKFYAQDKKLDGRKIAREIKQIIKDFAFRLDRKPTLAIVNSGLDPASNYYVKSIIKNFNKIGLNAIEKKFEPGISQQELISLINNLNSSNEIDGIQVQVPLPKHLNTQMILDAISEYKDVDCQSTKNLGKLVTGNNILFYPNTALAIYSLLKYYDIKPEGKNVVILNRSIVIGKPLALMLLEKDEYANATVTVCHSRTQNLEEYLLNADILIIGIGRANFIKSSMIKKDAVVIDAGINDIIVDGKHKMVGDVDFEDVYNKVSLITPVPGGVGSITTSLLMFQTLKAFLYRKIKNE